MNEYDLLEEWTEAAGLCFDGVGDCSTTGPVRRMDILQLIRVARDLKSKEASKAVPVADEAVAYQYRPDQQEEWRTMHVRPPYQSIPQRINELESYGYQARPLYLRPSQPEPTSKGADDEDADILQQAYAAFEEFHARRAKAKDARGMKRPMTQGSLIDGLDDIFSTFEQYEDFWLHWKDAPGVQQYIRASQQRALSDETVAKALAAWFNDDGNGTFEERMRRAILAAAGEAK